MNNSKVKRRFKNHLTKTLKELVNKRISKKCLVKHIYDKIKLYNPLNISYDYVKSDNLLEDEDYRIIFSIDFGKDVITGDIWFLKHRNKKIIFITEISVD